MSIKPNKDLGQHWLYDKNVLDSIVESAEIEAGDNVLEIGPGLGTLTSRLTKKNANVTAVEFDKELYKKLLTQASNNLKIINQDIRNFNLTSLSPNYKVVANIPYYLTSNLVRILSETSNPPSTVALLVQKEVAERLAAKPGNMSILTVIANYYWQISLDIIVPAELFTPPPKVDSQVVVLRRLSKPSVEVDSTKEFFRVVKAGFAAKRKTLLNSLAGGLRLSKKDTSLLMKEAVIDPHLRAQALSLEDWAKLYQAYKNFTS